MKRKYLWGLALFLTSFLALFLPEKVLADYDLTKMQVTAVVNADGSLSMTRKIVYDFDDSANGVYYTQKLASGQKLSAQSVEVTDLASGKSFKPLLNNQAASGNVYHFNKSGNSYKFKVYHRVEEGKVQVVYRYKISGAVATYDDASELNFKIIGDGWEKEISNVTATVRFKGQNLSFLKGWAHVNASGHLTVDKKKGLVKAEVATLPESTFLELHLLFPNSLVSQNKQRHSGEIAAKVVDQEKRLAQETAAKKSRHNGYELIGLVLFFLSPLLYLPVFFKSRKSGSPVRPKKELGHNFEIPAFSPTTAQILVSKKDPDASALAAEIALRAGRGEITISPDKKGKNYTYAKTSKYTGDLPLLNKIFKKVGNGKSFSNKELRRSGDSNGITASYKNWQQASQKNLVKEGYVDQVLLDREQMLSLYSVGVMLLSVAAIAVCFFLYDKYIFWLIPAIIWVLAAFGVAIFRLHRFSYLTEKGAQATEQALAFEAMLDDIGQFKLRDIGELTLWEQIMPYAIAFGLAKKVLKQLKLEFPEEIATDPYWTCYYAGPGYGDFASGFAAAVASSSGSGGSFSASSASSGGFGGGSGGGAF
ncbi:membrane protein [Lactobacillus nasalidis]|uniref:Membrane protein n=1 Tax=Lactobacillus nasalidis TaxID=2797258 RepID=A0ABQ3W4B5_9LACO|nr:DUF2207 domain-containing protein [Lactobacillus nasalidis]GHV97379.1 membrane protein [Lactobacillus nasalidis]GHV99321.1 membrane protein [Lactobacillus nasalidis]GHW00514.1 membrane protein [Lactobacillus nasalidis]